VILISGFVFQSPNLAHGVTIQRVDLFMGRFQICAFCLSSGDRQLQTVVLLTQSTHRGEASSRRGSMCAIPARDQHHDESDADLRRGE
jgi:hypothetical protein